MGSKSEKYARKAQNRLYILPENSDLCEKYLFVLLVNTFKMSY